MLAKIEGKGKSGWQRMRWLESITEATDMNLSKFREVGTRWGTREPGVLQSVGLQSWTRLSDLTKTTGTGTKAYRLFMGP